MATDVERLVVSLEASITKYERAMQRALGQTNTTAKKIEDRFAQTNRKVAALFETIGSGIQIGLAKAFASAAALRGAQQLIDASTRIQNSLKLTGLEGEALAKVYTSLFASAQRNAVPLEALAQLYGRATLSQKDLKASTQDLLKFTENVSVALRVNGASAEQSSGALLQLSQLLSSGTVRAEEFNSVQEGALPILQAVAAGLKEAGGSVAKLRSLVIDGKLSSAAFFAAFEAGSSVLTDKVASAEFTVSQGFIRLQNVLVDLAGKFNQSTGASESFVATLDKIAEALGRLEGSRILSWLGQLNNLLESSGFLQLDTSLQEIERILGVLDSTAGAVADSFDGLAHSTGDAVAAALGYETAAAAPAALRAEIEKLSTSLNTGKTDADTLRQKLIDLGASPLNLAIQISQIMDLARAAVAASGAIAAINGGKPAAPGIALQRDEQSQLRDAAPISPISIKDPRYSVDPTKKGKGSKSPGQKYDDDLAAQARRTEQLRQETAAQAALNPLVNDYGFAITKLRTQQQLENDATKAGLDLTPDRKAAIEQLAIGYANATVEAAKLADAQDDARQSMQDWFSSGRDVARGFIDDLREGKTAAEALGNAFGQIGDRLLDLGLDAIFGTGKGASPFGFLGSIFGFAKGGIARNGKPVMKTFARGGVSNSAAIFGEGPMAEAAVPLPDGRRIPVDLRMSAIPAATSSQSNVHVTAAVYVDENGNWQARVEQISQKTMASGAPSIVSASVSQANKSAPGAISQYQQQRAGSDYRV